MASTVGQRAGVGANAARSISRSTGAPDALVGTRLGSAVLESVIGEGGMGVVYSARQDRLDREIAVKVLPGIFNADPSRVRRFLSEAKILSRVNHPHVVSVYDAGDTDGMLWIAMEKLHGRPLSAIVTPGGVAADRVVALAAQICDALHAAHSAGVTHRDLKPENIFLLPGEPDVVKVLDFGIARSEADRNGVASGSGMTSSSGMTSGSGTTTGSITGTPGYMSPEQVLGEDSGPTTDVYSLGVVLYELLAGRRPFDGPTPLVMAAHVRDKPPDLRTVAPKVPPALAAVVMSALQKQPTDRPPSALAFRDALVSASLETRRRLPHGPAIAIAAVVLTIAIVAMVQWDRDVPASPWTSPPDLREAPSLEPSPLRVTEAPLAPGAPRTLSGAAVVALAATNAASAGGSVASPSPHGALPVSPDTGTTGTPLGTSAPPQGRLSRLPAFSATDAVLDLLATLKAASLEQIFTLDADAIDAALPGWRTDHYDLPSGFSERVTEVAVPGATRNVELRLQLFGRRLSALSVRVFERDAALEWEVAGALGRPGAAVTDFDGCAGFEWTMGELHVLVRTHRDDDDDTTAPVLHALVIGPAATWRADRIALSTQTTVASALETARESIDDGGDGVAAGIIALVAVLDGQPAAASVRVELCRARYETGDVTAARRECERVRDASVDLVSRARAEYFLALIAATQGTSAAAIEAMATLAARLDEAVTPPEARRLKVPVGRRLGALRGARDDELVTDLFCRRAALEDREVDRATFIDREFGFAEGELDRRATELELDSDDCD